LILRVWVTPTAWVRCFVDMLAVILLSKFMFQATYVINSVYSTHMTLPAGIVTFNEKNISLYNMFQSLFITIIWLNEQPFQMLHRIVSLYLRNIIRKLFFQQSMSLYVIQLLNSILTLIYKINETDPFPILFTTKSNHTFKYTELSLNVRLIGKHIVLPKQKYMFP